MKGDYIGLSSLILYSKEKNQGILLSELANILSQIRRLTKNYKKERIEIKYQLIEALGYITFNLVKTNNRSVTHDSHLYPNLVLMLEEFVEDKDPTIRLKVLELIEKVGQINIENQRELNVYNLNTLLMKLMEDKDPSVKEKAFLIKKKFHLHLKFKLSCLRLFLKVVPETTH